MPVRRRVMPMCRCAILSIERDRFMIGPIELLSDSNRCLIDSDGLSIESDECPIQSNGCRIESDGCLIESDGFSIGSLQDRTEAIMVMPGPDLAGVRPIMSCIRPIVSRSRSIMNLAAPMVT